MTAVNPTYPLFPIASILAVVMLLLVLTSSLVRQSWNIGVTFLCFWLLLENLTLAINSIVWSDNAEVRLYVYCDIVIRVHEITYVIKPMATLLITRRLYLISSLQSVDFPSRAKRRWNSVVEWTLGLAIPLLVAGPIYYVHQIVRFEVDEGFGCSDGPIVSILELLTIEIWAVLPPLVSIVFYYPKVVRMFYRQSRDIRSFLNSNDSVSRTNYLRIIALASIDIILTFPLGVVNIVLHITSILAQPGLSLPFYWGWDFVHSDWEPVSFTYADIRAYGAATLAQYYVSRWTSPILAFSIFGLLGLTSEARASYWRTICIVGGWFGWKPNPRVREGRTTLGEIEFGARPQETSLGDMEMGSHRPSFVNPAKPAAKQYAEHPFNRSGAIPESNLIEEMRRSSIDVREAEGRVSIDAETITHSISD
ncbi:STE3-domain-containing protein [Peniophora sp. CONT]|nr:STE3-domain-containing protein [Peniophora sp. CONT]